MKEKLAMWVSKRLPRRLVYWSAVRVLANATSGKYSNTEVPALTGMEALMRWK